MSLLTSADKESASGGFVRRGLAQERSGFIRMALPIGLQALAQAPLTKQSVKAAERPAGMGLAFGGLLALAAAMGIGRFVYTPILPFMSEGLGLTAAQAGLIASANFLGYLIGALLGVQPRLPGGLRLWFLGGLALSAATTGAMGLVTGLESFLLLRFLGGLASAFVLVFASALVLERLAAAGRSGLSAIHFAGVGAGIAISAVLIAGLAAFEIDWRGQWLASGAMAFLALILVFQLVSGTKNPLPAAKTPAGGSALKSRDLLIMSGAYGLFGFGYVITATFISALTREEPALQAIEPWVWLVVGLACLPSVAFWIAISKRWGDCWAFSAACLVQACGVALSVLTVNAFLVLLGAALLGATIMGITALGLVIARRLAPESPSRAMALMTAVFGVGQMIGPAFAGYAYQLGDSFLFPSLVAAGALVIGASSVFLVKRKG